jgi:hypothetical protein
VSIDTITFRTADGDSTLTGDAVDRFLSGEEREDGRRLTLGGDPDALYRVPSDAAFDGGDFIPDPRLDELGQALRERWHLPPEPVVIYRWKRKGGQHQGAAVAGFCAKLSGLAKHFGEADFCIWLGADHIRESGHTAFQVEALIFHELHHINVEEDDKGEIKFTVRHHDAEIFLEEIRAYGLWREEHRRAKDAIEQIPLVLS